MKVLLLLITMHLTTMVHAEDPLQAALETINAHRLLAVPAKALEIVKPRAVEPKVYYRVYTDNTVFRDQETGRPYIHHYRFELVALYSDQTYILYDDGNSNCRVGEEYTRLSHYYNDTKIEGVRHSGTWKETKDASGFVMFELQPVKANRNYMEGKTYQQRQDMIRKTYISTKPNVEYSLKPGPYNKKMLGTTAKEAYGYDRLEKP